MTTTAPERCTSTRQPSIPACHKGNPWLPTWSGVALVARIEMLRRRPTRKGYIFYGLMLGFIALLSLARDAQRG